MFLLAASVRLTSLNVFRAVDEEDRWAWAIAFYQALLAGDLAGTLVGDGYPGIFPVWLETLWLLVGSLYRSILQGGWIGDEGVYLLIHEWSRTEYLGVQRFPVVLTNTLLVVIIFLYLRRLFGQKLAWLAAVFISLDPFYLSDSRVNRAEALLTGLMTISLLALILALQQQQRKHLLISAIVGGLAWLTKSQALVLLPIFTVITLIWQFRAEPNRSTALRRWVMTMMTWVVVACATFSLLWPAIWTVPGSTFARMLRYLTRKVGEEGVMIFFLGRTLVDEDPGLLFYPVIFILRATPLMLIGLLLGLWLLVRHYRSRLSQLADRPSQILSQWRAWLDDTGLWALLVYVVLYAGGMSLGSNKHDRFLMAAFLPLNILAATAFIKFLTASPPALPAPASVTPDSADIPRQGPPSGFQEVWRKHRLWLAGGALLTLQLITALPYHPYYFTYFNPLVGGGPVAARLTRIGWGEGMDQVGAYLQSLEEADSLVVASRFYRYLLGFKGKKLNLENDGEWVQADKVVFYIQQAQRMLDPSPGVIRYFQQHVPPEKIITIDGIDYAWIYPNPIRYPADPLVDRLENEMNLFGYRWQADTGGKAQVWLIWENLSPQPRPVGVRLWANGELHGEWSACHTAPEFTAAIQTPGEVVESQCPLSAQTLSPGLYDLQVGVQQADGAWLSLDFAAGWAAVELAGNGAIERVSAEVAFARLAEAAIPETATRLEHTYYDRIRLLAYELSPDPLRPGQTLTLTLYWQALRVLDRDAHISLQAFIGENQQIAIANGPPLDNTRPTRSWRPGEVLVDSWNLVIPAETPAPAMLRLDVTIFMPETLTPLPVQNLAGEDIPAAITQVRLEPVQWPLYAGLQPLTITFSDAIRLDGYDSRTAPAKDALEVTLYWRSLTPLAGSYVAFLHLVNTEGVLVAQSDTLPAQGFFPTSAWQPGDTVLSQHHLSLPPDLPAGNYTLLAGLYRPEDGSRLSVLDTNSETFPNNAVPIGQVTLE